MQCTPSEKMVSRYADVNKTVKSVGEQFPIARDLCRNR
jgi:hypothetical protein